MHGAGTRIAAAARAGAAFAAEAWRDAWAPLLLLAAGQGAAFVSGHVDLGPALAGRIQLGGWIVSAAALLPALGALYRSAVGGRALKEIGPGGLQLGEVERRLVGVGLLLALAGGAALAVLLVAGAAVWYPLRNLGVVRVPFVGPFGLWFLAGAPVLAIVGWGLLVGLSRLALLAPAAAAENRMDVARTLRGSRRWSGSLAASMLLFDLLPVAVLAGFVALLGWLEQGQMGGLTGAIWPTADAAIAGATVSLLWAFVILPAGVGARTSFYGRVLAEARARDRRAALALDDAGDAASPTVDDAQVPAASDEAAEAAGDEVAERDAGDAEAGDVAAGDEAVAAEASDDAASGADAPSVEEVAAEAKGEDEAASEEASAAAERPAARWVAPVPSVRGAALARSVTTPVLLAHANDRDLPPPWWMPPEHPEGPSVA